MKSEGRAATVSRDSPTEKSDGANANAKRHICPKCGLFINSEESLKVHMQYQHDNMSRWGAPTTTIHSGSISITTTSQPTPSLTTLSSNSVSESGSATTSGGSITSLSNLASKSPTDSENNNHHKNKQIQLHHQVSPLHNTSNTNANNTVSAAADSSNNQSPTPVPGGGGDQAGGAGHNFSVSNSYHPQQGNNLIQDMHPYNPYVHGYDFPPHPMMDTSMYPMPYQTGTEYKSVPSNRYHPYHTPNHMHPSNQATTNGTNPTSSSASNSSLSPRVVSSSSPTQNSIMGQSGGGAQDSNAMNHIPQGQPTPSPSPKQCDKCGYVCQTDVQLSEHYTTTHGIQQNDVSNRSGGNNPGEADIQNQYSYQPYIKEEPSSDILDLDSQKMIYPATATGPVSQDALPSMHSVHAMHRSSLMWGADMHSGYMPHPQPDIKQSYFPSMRPTYGPIKQEFPTGPGYGAQVIKAEFNAHHQPIIPQSRSDIKPFTTDINTGNNPATSSPSEFPSTTTPQDNGSQFRGFEPPTSSLPNNPPSTKSAAWKSNEARRPKTYNCTACNKWFTSSGHLKRHYNTTLHKNAVKSSGQPDPATMPISAHHHPSRDPNSKHHRNNQSQQPPPAPPEPPRSPEYTPQYTPPPVGFTQSAGSFQQYNPSAVSIHSNGHPNGQAGPSVHASQQRGLLALTTMEAMCNQQPGDHSLQAQEEQYHQVLEHQANPAQQQQQQQLHQETHFILEHHMSDQQDTMSPHTINTMGHQYIINHLPAISTHSTTQSFQRMLQVEAQQNLPTITGNDGQMDADPQDLHIMDTIAYDPTANDALQIATIHQIETTDDGHQISHITTINPSSVMELQRLSRGQNSIVYPQNVPELLPGSPQEADIAPQQQQTGRVAAGTGSPNMPSSTILVIPISPNNINPNNHHHQHHHHHHQAHQKQQLQMIGDSSSGCSETGSSKPSSPTSMSPIIGDATGPSSTTSPSTTTGGKVECRECGKEFAKACYLTQHNKTLHSGEQPFRCQKCGKRFQTQDTYDIHLDKHKCKDKPYKCDTCPKQFHHKTDLRRHKDGHTGYKAHVCDTCNKGFCRKDHLRKHCDTHKPKPQKIAKKLQQ